VRLASGGNPKLRILLINTGIFPVPPNRGGGIELHTYNLARALSELGSEVHYITDITNEARFNSNVMVYNTHTPRMRFQAGFGEWVMSHVMGGAFSFKTALSTLLFKRSDFDIVHVHGNLSGLLVSFINEPTPLVFTTHNPTPWMCRYESSFEQKFREAAYRLVDANLIKRTDHIVALNQRLKDEIVAKWSIPPSKVTVVPNGVDTRAFCPDSRKAADVRAKYRIEGMYCLFVGQLRNRKGVDSLLRAFNEIDNNKMKCVVVGDGPERDKLEKLADDFKLHSKVLFTGAVPFEDLTDLYAEAEFFVLPTVAEGSPLVVLEAMASGLPVISTKVSGIPEVIDNEQNGFIVPPRDVHALAECMRVLIEDDELRAKMSKTARKKTVASFSWNAVARKTLAVYRKAIEDKSG